MHWVVRRLTSLIVIAIAVGGLALIIRAKMPSSRFPGDFKTYTKFRDGSRLAVGSAVVIAGVQVGRITKLTVESGLARIDMQLREGLDLPGDSFATKRADSLFGDSYIEIIPGGGSEGADAARRIRDGDPISHVVEGGSTDALLRSMVTGLPRMDNALDVVHDAMIEGRSWVAGPFADRMSGVATWLTEGHIEGPLESADRAVIKIDDLTTRGASAVHDAGPEVAARLERIDRAVTDARSRMRDVRAGLVGALGDTRAGLDRVDPQIAQARDLMTAIDEGHASDWKGTLGRLVNQPQLGDRLEDVTESGREAVASFNRFKSWLGMRVEFNVFSKAVRFYATAEIRAHQDKFYLVEFERGPLGGVPSDSLSEVVGSDAYTRRQEIPDRLRFTAQFGKQFGRYSLRGGLKDSTFGFGADALFLDGRLKISTDLYGAFQATPRLKVAGAFAVFRSIYVLAGVDDALNQPGYLPVISGQPGAPRVLDEVRYGRDYFFGTMLFFTDEDISVLLRVYGALLVGLL